MCLFACHCVIQVKGTTATSTTCTLEVLGNGGAARGRRRGVWGVLEEHVVGGGS